MQLAGGTDGAGPVVGEGQLLSVAGRAGLGAGLRPGRPLSLDLLFHRYRQDVPSRRLENTELDAKPSGLDPHLGSEWDLVVGYEPRKEFELRLTGGYFQPGKAFPADATPSTIATVQARFRF